VALVFLRNFFSYDIPVACEEKYAKVVDTNKALPLTAIEQGSLAELMAELSTSCYAGILTLQAMGLGGWIYDGWT
jgi:hypothetical protein